MIMRETSVLLRGRWYLLVPLRSRLSNNSLLNEAPRDSSRRFRESISPSAQPTDSRRVNTHSASTCAGYYTYFNERTSVEPEDFHSIRTGRSLRTFAQRDVLRWPKGTYVFVGVCASEI